VKAKKGSVKEIENEKEAVATAAGGEEDAVWSPHSATTTVRTDGADGDSGLQSDEGDEEGEGSLEDAIASLSSKVERVVSSTGNPGPVPFPVSVSPPIAHGEGSLEEGRDFEATPKVKGETVSGLLNIDSLGAGLPINIREALRYRIRKKM
jgi:hypothetical protein